MIRERDTKKTIILKRKGDVYHSERGGGNFEGSNVEDELTFEGTFLENKKLRWRMGV